VRRRRRSIYIDTAKRREKILKHSTYTYIHTETVTSRLFTMQNKKTEKNKDNFIRERRRRRRVRREKE